MRKGGGVGFPSSFKQYLFNQPIMRLKKVAALLFFIGIGTSTLFGQSDPFITIWNSGANGFTGSQQIEIHADGTNYLIEWEEIDNPSNNGSESATGTHTLTLPKKGIYQITFSGSIHHFYFPHGDYKLDDSPKLLSVEQWGDIQWSSMEKMFNGVRNLEINATDVPNLTNVTSLSQTFKGVASNLELNDWDVSSVQDMSGLFAESNSSLINISNWNTANVTNMSGMFYRAKNFNTDISNWDTGAVTDMSNMFERAEIFNQDISRWNTSNVIDMSGMFKRVEIFNQDIGGWDTGNVTDMSEMFFGVYDFNQSINSWNTENVTNMSQMFVAAISYNQPLMNWNTSNVTNMSGMFYGAGSFNQSLMNWDTESVTDMSQMFRSTTYFNQPLNTWNTSNVTNMSEMFASSGFNQDISNWNTKNVTNMKGMFSSPGGIIPFNQDISDWDTGNVSDMSNMFDGARYFNQPLNTWNTSNVINMSGMFKETWFFDRVLDNWDTKNVTDMSEMFYEAKQFNQDLSDWDISNVATMQNMFFDTPISVQNYDNILTGWGTKAVKSNVELGAAALVYCFGYEGRKTLIDDYNWNIAGDIQGCSVTEPLISIWKADNPGMSAENQVRLLVETDLIYLIEWEEVDNPANQGSETASGPHTITFPKAGTYKISMTGEFDRFYFPDAQGEEGTDARKLLSVEQWGNAKWSTTQKMFKGARNFELNALDNPDLSEVKSMYEMFNHAYKFNSNINDWDVSNVKNMGRLFLNADSFNQPLDNWDMSGVTNITSMFHFAKSFNQNINSWNTSSIVYMSGVFGEATSYNQPLDNWETGNAINMGGMFSGATLFNQNINSWNTENALGFGGMFRDAVSFNQPLNNWNTGSATSMQGMFRGATSFNQDISDWGTGNVETMAGMFHGAVSFNQDISNWHTPNLEYIHEMFEGATSFNSELNNWDVSNVFDMREVFKDASSFNRSLSNWNTGNVQDMSGMFKDAENFNRDLSTFELERVQFMHEMLDGSGLSTENYDNTLTGWSGQTVNNDVELGADGLTYCNAVSERQTLIDTNNWTFLGDVQDCNTSFSVAYNANWNLVGIPEDLAATPYGTYFTKATQPPFIYNTTYQESSDLNDGIGYWVYLSESETVEYGGTLQESLTLNLDADWNLVSGIGSSLDVTDIQDPDNILTSDWFGFDGAYFTASILEAGHGYWIKADEAGSITLEQPTAKSQPDYPIASYNPREAFNRLNFIAGEKDTLQTLYFGSTLPEKIKAKRFALPPIPPTGSFDVRFSVMESRLTEADEPSIDLQVPEGKSLRFQLSPTDTQLGENWTLIQLIDGVPHQENQISDGVAIDLYSSAINQLQLKQVDAGFPEQMETPVTYGLHQNYPNPFNPTTQITYQIPEQQSVRLEVYNMLGRKVTELVNETQVAGSYSVMFDASNLTSGVYIYRLSAGSFSQVRRLVLVK